MQLMTALKNNTPAGMRPSSCPYLVNWLLTETTAFQCGTRPMLKGYPDQAKPHHSNITTEQIRFVAWIGFFGLLWGFLCVFLFVCFCLTQNMWRFSGQGSNPVHNSDQSCSSDNVGSITIEPQWEFWDCFFKKCCYFFCHLLGQREVWIFLLK